MVNPVGNKHSCLERHLLVGRRLRKQRYQTIQEKIKLGAEGHLGYHVGFDWHHLTL